MKLLLRLLLVGIGVVLGAGFLLLATRWSSDVLWHELFVNLAASALTISITASTVDYILDRDNARRRKKAVRIGEKRITDVLRDLKLHIAMLYGYRPPNEKENIFALTFERPRITALVHGLSFFESELHTHMMPTYFESLQLANHRLYEFLTIYSSVFSEEVIGDILDLKDYLGRIVEEVALPQTTDHQKIANASASWVCQKVKKLEAHFKDPTETALAHVFRSR